VTGLFITFEGPDGAGKTTQIKRLAEYAANLSREIIVTREPGGTPVSDLIRSIVLSPVHTELRDQTEVLLYAASRAQHVYEKIVPALERGSIVLCDRFVDASIAYQAFGLDIDVATVRVINQFATGGLVPHRTYMLDISAEESIRRLHDRAQGAIDAGVDRIEQRKLDYHQRVREAFLRIADQNRERVQVIAADRSVETIAAEIAEDFYRWFERLRMDKGSATH